MAKLIVLENGFFECDGVSKCGGTNFSNRGSMLDGCKYCSSYQRDGLKIIDKRCEKKLTDFWKNE